MRELDNRVVVAAIVLFGAIVHATAQLKISREKQLTFDLLDFSILVIIAGFSGLIFGMIATALFENQMRVNIASGIGAFIGLSGLNKVANIFLEIFQQLLTRNSGKDGGSSNQ